MNTPFSLIPQWLPTERGPEEIRQTVGVLRIDVRGQSATRVDDDWAKSVRDTVRVACYPLAVWFASSWWRLCWEPVPKDTPNTDWCLSHEMHGAGHGFLWPPLRFETDGETVSVICTPSSADSSEPIRYLTTCRKSISVGAFTEAIESFIETVLARLEIVGIQNTELHTLWRDVVIERGDSQAASYRKLEAILGFDPDNAPELVANRLLQLSENAGEAAVAEIAAACSGPGSSFVLRHIEKSIGSAGIKGTLQIWPSQIRLDSYNPLSSPWDRGRAIARATRAALDSGDGPISDQNLCDIFSVQMPYLTGEDAPMSEIPWGLVIRTEQRERVRLLFRRKNVSGRRFEMARWLGDILSAPACDRWLPATDAKTARQQMQRAFAAEFLAPIQALCSFLEGDVTDEDRIEDAGHYFRVSPLMIRSHLSNHGLVSADFLTRH